ncbi:YqzG/YhdC family protein [Oceanobacillus sp. CAU 1775]
MWKVSLIVGVTLLALNPGPAPIAPATLPILLEEIPPYAKWGRVAMQETKEKYPDADIIDYLHIGKEMENEKSIEKFKLWLKAKDREFGVFITIHFDTQTEEVIDIIMEETDR